MQPESEKKIVRNIQYPRKFYLELMDSAGVFIGTPLRLTGNRILISVNQKLSAKEDDSIQGAIYGVRSRESCVFVGRIVSRWEENPSEHVNDYDHFCRLEIETEESLPPGIRLEEESNSFRWDRFV